MRNIYQSSAHLLRIIVISSNETIPADKKSSINI